MEEQGMLSYVKKVIHSLVVSTPLEVTVEGLKRDYLSVEGSPLPYNKFGFKDIESFLHSIPDTVQLLGCGPMAQVVAVKNAKSAHIQSLVRSQKKPSNNARNRKRQKSIFVYPSERSDLVFLNERYNSSRRFDNNYHNHATKQPQKPAGYCPPSRNNYNESRLPVASQQIMSKETISMTTSFARFNITNVDDESSSDELDNFQMYLPDGDSVAKGNRFQPSSPVHFDNNANPTTNKVEKKAIDNSSIQYVSSDEGCDEDAIPSYAVDERVLNYKYTRNISCLDLVTDAPAMVPQVKGITKEPVIEYLSSDDGSDSEAIPAYAVDDRVLSVEYPNDAVRFDQPLPSHDIRKKMKIDSRIQVQLVTVANPHSFYFWIHDEEYDEYKAMSINMQRYYDTIDDRRYTIPMFLIIPGHLAACRSIIWQRVRVLNIKAGSKKNIEVEHIDTGERMWVCHSDLKYLCKEFATLPAQCWHGRLSCVMPRQGTHFSADASNYFYDLVSYRRLFAKIEKINEPDNTVHMILVDPDALSYTKNINIALIESGWVRRCYKP